MKTKFLKIGMPIMVFMLAIVFAFATEKTTSTDESLLVTGYIMQDGLCVTSEKNCDNVAIHPCKDGGKQVYSQRLGESVCSQELFNSFPD